MIQTLNVAVCDEIYVRGVEYRVLGPLEVLLDGRACTLGGPKQRAALAVLVAAEGRPVSVDSLLQAIYGDDASPSSRATLHTFVSNLRSSLGDVIVRRSDSYLLDLADAVMDAAEFEREFKDAHKLGSAEDMASRLRDALSIWRGHPYADIEAHGHLDGQITRLNELRLAAIEARVDADLRAGRHREVVAELDALTVEYPFREGLRAMHMLALYRSGRQGDALRAYAHTRVVLVEELGIDPSPELQQLEQRILQQDRELLLDVAPIVEQRAVVVADIEDAGWSSPAQREMAFARRDSALAWAADEQGGVRLSQKGTAAYAVFNEPIQAVRAARAAVDTRTRVAVDFGDLQIEDGEPFGPPLARAARLVAVAHAGQALMSPAAHEALTLASVPGWAAESLGRFDIVGLDRGVQIFQFVGNGFASDFPPLVLDRLPPPLPSGVERSIPGYEVRALLGIGELGEVHRAYQPSVGREVAVRVFGPGMVGHPLFLRRFETAAQRVSRVEHPGVVPLVDYWREPSRAVLVSRLMTGGSLRYRLSNGGLDTTTALRIFDTVASAVGSAHRRGIVHGRLRPSNVLFDEDGNAFVADFGVDEMCTGVTSFAASAYDAPERLGGALATPAADIYSLGALIHELLAGSVPPVDADLPQLDSPAAAVIARAVNDDPRQRYGSVEELAADLRKQLIGGFETADVFVPTRNPYRGLAAFEQADAVDFFGRDRATAEMIDVLREQPLLWVVGPSGIGKSSAVKAGLLPALAGGAITASDSWLVTEMVPGRSPLEQLTAALTRVATEPLPDVVSDLMGTTRSLDELIAQIAPSNVVVLVIDQFEELFTETADDGERRAFLQMLVSVANATPGAVRVVATMRADFFDRPLAYPGFADAVKGRSVVLGAMTLAELAEAVSRPAAGVGVEVDPVLVDRVTADAALQPGSLPLLQHVMADLFAKRTSNRIGTAAYLEAGGLAGAIGRQADAIYRGLDDRQQDVTRRLFLRLVNVNEEGEDTRRRARRSELEQAGIAGDDLAIVLDAFGSERLLTFDRDSTSRTPTVEVAHEALLTEWDRLRGWIDDARDDLLTRRRVEQATNEWINAGCENSFLLSGGRLELTEAWAAHSGFALTNDETRFLSTSRAKFDRDLRARTRRRRSAVGVLVVALLATTALAGVALRQRNRADRSGTLAEARRIGTQARGVVGDYDTALLLAVEGRHLDDSPETRENLLATIQRSRAVAVLRGSTDTYLDVTVTSDGNKLLASGYGSPNGLGRYDISTRRQESSVASDGYSAISADGRFAVVSRSTPSGDSYVNYLQLMDLASFAVLDVEMIGGDQTLTRLSFSPDGRYVAAVTDTTSSGDGRADAIAMVWDAVNGGQPVLTYSFPAPFFQRDVRFLPDSERILAAGSDGTAIVDIASGQRVGLVADAHAPIAVSPDGRTLAAVTDPSDGLLIGLFDLATGESGATLGGHQARNLRLVFSPDGTMLASGSDDHLVMVWNIATGARTDLVGHTASVNALAFSPDGGTLWSGGNDRAILEWDLREANTLAHVPRTFLSQPDPSPTINMAFDSTGRYVVLPSTTDPSFQIRDANTGVLLRTADPDEGNFMSFSPDGTRYLTVSLDEDWGHVRVWDLRSGAVLADSGAGQFSEFHEGLAWFTPDGSRVVAIRWTDVGENLVVLDAATLTPVGDEVPVGKTVRMLGLTPDGGGAIVVVSGANDLDPPGTRVLFVDLEKRQISRSTPIEPLGEPFEGARNNTVAADGRTVGVGNFAGDVVIVDAMAGTVSPVLHAHEGQRVESITFAPDYSTFVTTATDGFVKLWDSKTHDLIASIRPFGDHRVRGSFLAADRVLLVDDRGKFLEWEPRPDGWEAYACGVAGRNFTKAEWADLLPSQHYHATCPQFPPGE